MNTHTQPIYSSKQGYFQLMRMASLLMALFFLTACSNKSLLPSVTASTESPWKSFSQAKTSFDQISPNVTTLSELSALGFDPFRTPNITRLTYLEVIQHFMPNQSIQIEDLDIELQHCIKARKSCYALAVKPAFNQQERYGGVMADIFKFRRKTRTTGWKFDALIVLNGDKVVYKIWGGEPNMLILEDKKTPLGPLQGIVNAVDIKLL
jgi:hypothetical protein